MLWDLQKVVAMVDMMELQSVVQTVVYLAEKWVSLTVSAMVE